MLAGRFEALRGIESAWAGHEQRWELYQCRDGNYQISSVDDRGERRWLPRLVDHKGEAERVEIPREEGALLPAPYLFEGSLKFFRKSFSDAIVCPLHKYTF